MQKQSDKKVAALYYRTAHKNTDNPHLDNQMQKLLCYATEQELDGFTLYADNGASGLTLDRPAFNALQADIKAERIGKLIVCDISRIARDFILVGNLIEWAQARGVKIISVTGGVLTVSPYGDIAAAYRALLKGGRAV